MHLPSFMFINHHVFTGNVLNNLHRISSLYFLIKSLHAWNICSKMLFILTPWRKGVRNRLFSLTSTKQVIFFPPFKSTSCFSFFFLSFIFLIATTQRRSSSIWNMCQMVTKQQTKPNSAKALMPVSFLVTRLAAQNVLTKDKFLLPQSDLPAKNPGGWGAVRIFSIATTVKIKEKHNSETGKA